MDFEETSRLGTPGYDERTETWYVQSPEAHRLMLTRQSLARLVQMYNSIYKGNTLVLLEQRELRRLEEARRQHSQSLRDLRTLLQHQSERSPRAILRRLLRPLARIREAF
jgi:hypothetical protein